MKEILIGTHNQHKTREIAEILAGLPFRVVSLSRFPEIKPVEEDGKTLEENAAKKARGYAEKSGLLTLADDTGLEVEALGGAPGVYSARYAGDRCSYEDNNRKLLAELSRLGNGNRRAVFRCVIACYDPARGRLEVAEGRLEGTILESLRGRHGFGYDPVFYVSSLQKTLAELTLEEKNRVSHRALAVRAMKEKLEKNG